MNVEKSRDLSASDEVFDCGTKLDQEMLFPGCLDYPQPKRNAYRKKLANFG
jgi:hypothetical protein